jgi:nicotinate-nucleotide adenylyltransferase
VDGLKLGLLGGTFDPPHVGHLWLAETARQQLSLDGVLFLPVGEPPHKQGNEITAVAHRLRMTQLAIAPNPTFTLNTSDADRPPPHTTYSLLPLIQAQYPGAVLWLLLGADSLRDFATWYRPVDIIAQCRLAVLARPGVMVDWAALTTAVPHLPTAVDELAGPSLDVSSTAVRHWARRRCSLRYLLPDAVLDYVQRHRLYEESENNDQ